MDAAGDDHVVWGVSRNSRSGPTMSGWDRQDARRLNSPCRAKRCRRFSIGVWRSGRQICPRWLTQKTGAELLDKIKHMEAIATQQKRRPTLW
jgi:hypothetical protein